MVLSVSRSTDTLAANAQQSSQAPLRATTSQHLRMAPSKLQSSAAPQSSCCTPLSCAIKKISDAIKKCFHCIFSKKTGASSNGDTAPIPQPIDHSPEPETRETQFSNAFLNRDIDTLMDLIRANHIPVNQTGYRHTTQTALHLICRENPIRIELVNELLTLGANLNACNDRGDTPLRLALQNAESPNQLEVVNALLSAGADIHEIHRQGRNTLHDTRDPTLIARFSEGGVSPLTQDLNGLTPLHYACIRNDSLETINALLEIGAQLNAADRIGATPLHYICHRPENYPTVARLIAAGADCTVADNRLYTPLHYAYENSCSIEVINLLRANGARAENLVSWTPLLALCKFKYSGPHPEQMQQRRNQIALQLLEEGVSLEACTTSGKTALHIAAENHDIAMMRTLIANGALVNARDEAGETPLHKAYCQNNNTPENLAFIQALRELGARDDITNNLGQIPSQLQAPI